MADNKADVGEPDRSRVAGAEDYEVRYLSEKHGISVQQARDLVAQHGNDRAKLDAAAQRLKSN